MTATVQATCPGCRNVLRIPADWAERAMKCKKCGIVMQGRRKAAGDTAPTAAAPTPPVIAQPVVVARPAADLAPHPFALDADSPTTRKYRGRKGRGWVNAVAFLVTAGGLGAAAFLFKDKILPPPKPDDPAANKQTAGPVDPAAGVSAPRLSDPFPRRLLFVHVSKYVYFNTLSAGKTAKGDDVPSETAKKMAFELRVPTDKENNQLVTLIDSASGKDHRPPLKATLTHAYEQFFATSRDQDRVVVYFGGHAVERDGKAFLVPAEGEPDDVNTLIPLDLFYAKLKECRAQQKVVLFDVCRFNPGFGAAKPGSEPMSDKLAAQLLAAPPGVQVLTSCSPKENAQESTTTGSEFLTAFRVTAGGAKGGKPPAPGEPIPLGPWADALTAALTRPQGDTIPQTPKRSGGDPPVRVEYNRDEPFAKRFDWPPPAKGAAFAEVDALIKLATLPGVRKELDIPPGLAEVYPFPADAVKKYATDGISEEASKDAAKFPVRAATLAAIEFIRKRWGMGGDGLRDSFEGTADDRVKKAIAKEQEPLAKLSNGLNELMLDLEAAEKKLDDEKSPRWKALFQYTYAQVQMRWAYLEEYNLSLGNIRTDSLQKPTGTDPVFRLVSVEKMRSKKDVKERAEAGKELMAKIAEDHKGTPWEVLAKMHKYVALGLEWKLVETKKAEEKN